MKKTTLCLMVCLLTASFAFATAPEKTSDFAVINKGRTLKVIYKASSENDVKIVIRDSGSKAVFEETLRNTDNFLRPYNLSQLPEGEYSVEITDNDGVHRKAVTVTNSLNKGLFHVVPVTGQAGKFLLTIGKMQNTKVNILVKNQFDHVLFESTRNADKEFGQIIDLTRVKGASITITDSNGIQKIFNL